MGVEPIYKPIEIEIANYVYDNPRQSREKVLSHFVAKCRKHKRTIERYYKNALEYNLTRIKKVEEVRDEVLVQTAKESTKRAVIDREQAEEILSTIALGSARKVVTATALIEGEEQPVKWEIVMPSNTERVKAISELGKMKGWEAAKKLDLLKSLSVTVRFEDMGEDAIHNDNDI